MPIQEFVVAQEECRLRFGRWQREMEGLRALVEDAPQYTAVAFLQSVHARMPEIHRANNAVLARLSILIQVMVETENETQSNKPDDFIR